MLSCHYHANGNTRNPSEPPELGPSPTPLPWPSSMVTILPAGSLPEHSAESEDSAISVTQR